LSKIGKTIRQEICDGNLDTIFENQRISKATYLYREVGVCIQTKLRKVRKSIFPLFSSIKHFLKQCKLTLMYIKNSVEEIYNNWVRTYFILSSVH
jgi:hypothetical protein